ncbi:Holliday junction branch migration protein RuvA [Thermodesulfobacteriota bacterium]
MIAALRGTIMAKGPNRVVVDVQGVGYDVAVSLRTLTEVAESEEVFLYVRTLMRENALELYGFMEKGEKELFELLIGVSGIGPRLALAVLSGISPDSLREAILADNVGRLKAVPGIGKKSAQRIIVDLKEKMKKVSFGADADVPTERSSGSLEEDLISSLINLGYRERDAEAAAGKVIQGSDRPLDLGEALKLAFKEMAK